MCTLCTRCTQSLHFKCATFNISDILKDLQENLKWDILPPSYMYTLKIVFVFFLFGRNFQYSGQLRKFTTQTPLFYDVLTLKCNFKVFLIYSFVFHIKLDV